MSSPDLNQSGPGSLTSHQAGAAAQLQTGVAPSAEPHVVVKPPRTPLQWVLDAFSSVWLAIMLLALLFIYSSIGSSGVPVHWWIIDPANWRSIRQLPWFELSEFEWFHWWPFDVLWVLICINLVLATIRKIPFNTVNLGVWMIHSGILILTLGSVWYFTTKVEGLAPVNRRMITIELPGHPPETMTAAPGNSKVVGSGDNQYELRVVNIDPHWELLSGDEAGQKAYKVSVAVRSKGGEFIRELIANRPQYTQDIIRTNNSQQPMARAKTVLGREVIDEVLKLTLDYAPQEYFFLMESHALYLREVGSTRWVQRQIHGLPRYNDYIAMRQDVWEEAGAIGMPLRPLRHIEVAASEEGDPLPNVTFNISRYLRYAELRSRRVPSVDGRIDPAVSFTIRTDQGPSQQYQLHAFDPANSRVLEGNVLFAWMDSQSAIERLKTRINPVVRFRVPGANVEVEQTIERTTAQDPMLPFTPIEGTEYAYRVESFQDNLTIAGRTVSIAILQIQTPQRTFRRWVFDDGTPNRDMALAEGVAQHDADVPLDEGIVSDYVPGTYPPAPIIITAGPGEHDLHVIVTLATGQPRVQPAKVGEPVPVVGDVTLTIDRYAPRTVSITKPLVIPREQRERDLEAMSLICLDVPMTGGVQSHWLRFHTFAFDRPEDVMRRFPYRPTVVTIEGRQYEMKFGRARMRLPAPVVLEDFRVKSHIGGFTGQTSSILDWESYIRFQDENERWGPTKMVRVNKPADHEGYWYYQAQWDPPDQSRFEGDPGSAGLNYTVLGVGNRNGVNVQLFGCCVSVLGMIFAFYVKPIIKRRQQQAVYAAVAEGRS